jgi:hypothetical protein
MARMGAFGSAVRGVAFALLLLAAGTARADEGPRERVARLVTAERGYQPALPFDAPPPEVASLPPPHHDSLPRPSVFSGLAEFLLIAAGVGLVAVAVVVLVRSWQRSPPPERATPEPERAPAAGRRPESPTLTAADELAARGRVAEAMHRLLLAVWGRLGASEPASRTSRELRRSVRVAPAFGPDLDLLVRAVERTEFAGDDPDAEAYRRCRAAAERLLSPEAAA